MSCCPGIPGRSEFWPGLEDEELTLDTGALDEILLCDQTCSVDAMTRLLTQAGFRKVEVYPAWDGLPLYDAEEWLVYVAEK